jgi:hypothetical protein
LADALLPRRRHSLVVRKKPSWNDARTAAPQRAKLFYEPTGSGDPFVLVHGSWIDG